VKTTASFFTGGALFDIGAQAAGYAPIWGAEIDDKIASVARRNGFPVLTADVTSLDLSTLERPDHFHASPPCPNFSNAKQDAEETELDIAMADAVCRALTHFKPPTFTLENVVGYRNGQSFRKIMKTLETLGYWYDATNLNAADFGVPQTRSRLWIRASRGLLRGYPGPTPWKGWYEAIADLIDELPDSEFAPWQIARLPEEYKTFMIGQGTRSSSIDASLPADTITANRNQKGIRAFIMQAQGENGKGFKEAAEPMQAMTAAHSAGKYRAFILDGQGNESERVTVRDGDSPIFTMTATNGKHPSRAFILSGGNINSNTFAPRDQDEPHTTITASMDRTPSRAHVNGRIVKMNIKALGRFQTVPDWYQGLTVKINGNGVPCLMAQRILETL
jgi:site-specific DNA-cytosine methylase